MVVFATSRNLDLLRENDEWLVDGTFSVCPLIFRQLYTVHCKLPEGKSVPCVYALLPSKEKPTYIKLLHLIADTLDGASPRMVHMDFESSMIEALAEVFPGTEVLGCSFHFNQSVWRWIQRNDPTLLRKCREDPDFFLMVRMFPALQFVPINDVRLMFELLLDSDFVRDNHYLLTPFINYFESTWVGRERNPALMKLDWWNVYQSTLDGTGRTNNEAEGWHSAFSGRIGARHPTFFKLAEDIRIEQGNTEFIVTNIRAQGIPTQPRQQYQDRQKRLHELVANYPYNGGLRFLENIAHSIFFK